MILWLLHSLISAQTIQGSRRIIAPTEALNINNEWRLIMNTQNYTQTVEIEECFGLAGGDDFKAEVEVTQATHNTALF